MREARIVASARLVLIAALTSTACAESNELDAGTDAAAADGGLDAGADAGGLDAGLDAGGLDAGLDAGRGDAGIDGGSDAGPPLRYLFVTDRNFVPQEGGVALFDGLCNVDTANPAPSSTFKALVMGTTRRACSSPACALGPDPLDWVLEPHTTYRRADGVVLFTTNANAIVTAYPIAETPDPTRTINTWSGMNGDWQPTEHCDDWTSASASIRGEVGWTAATDRGTFGSAGFLSCDAAIPIVCVEQAP